MPRQPKPSGKDKPVFQTGHDVTEHIQRKRREGANVDIQTHGWQVKVTSGDSTLTYTEHGRLTRGKSAFIRRWLAAMGLLAVILYAIGPEARAMLWEAFLQMTGLG
jgi:hypothetical protein